jgi:hypothetical protein
MLDNLIVFIKCWFSNLYKPKKKLSELNIKENQAFTTQEDIDSVFYYVGKNPAGKEVYYLLEEKVYVFKKRSKRNKSLIALNSKGKLMRFSFYKKDVGLWDLK